MQAQANGGRFKSGGTAVAIRQKNFSKLLAAF